MALKIDSQRWKAMVWLYRGDVNNQRDIGPFHTYASKDSTSNEYYNATSSSKVQLQKVL